jgi:hypothetical protein
MRTRNLRSLPKSLMDVDRKIPYDIERVDEMHHDAMILWLAVDILNKYGFFDYASSMGKIGAHVSNGGIDPFYPRAGYWGKESKKSE